MGGLPARVRRGAVSHLGQEWSTSDAWQFLGVLGVGTFVGCLVIWLVIEIFFG